MFYKPLTNYLVILALLLAIVSCRTIKPTAPPEAVLPYSIETAPSYISLTLETSIDQLELYVNKQFNGLVYEDLDFKNNGVDNLMVKAWKQKPIELSLTGNELQYEIPLKLWIKYNFVGEKFGITFSQPIEVEGAILLKFKSKFTINPNWNVSTTTTPVGYHWLESPLLKFGIVDLPVGFIADNLLKNQQEPLAKKIDKMVTSQLNLRQYGNEAWKALSTPMKISDDYNTWVVLQPVDLYTIPITSTKGKIVHQMSVKALAEVFVGQPPYRETTPLPDMKIVDNVEKNFSVMLQTRLLYTEMQSIAKKFVGGKPMKIGEKNITITDLNIFPSGEKLAIKADVEGSLKGTLYLTGIPVYDTAKAEIRLDKVDFDVSTKNFLLKTSSWILNGYLNRKIAQQLVFPVDEQVEEARNQINQYINHTKLTPELTLNGKIHQIGFGEIKLLYDGLLIPVTLEGNLKVSLKAF